MVCLAQYHTGMCGTLTLMYGEKDISYLSLPASLMVSSSSSDGHQLHVED